MNMNASPSEIMMTPAAAGADGAAAIPARGAPREPAVEGRRVDLRRGHEAPLDHGQPLAMLHLPDLPAALHRHPDDRHAGQESPAH